MISNIWSFGFTAIENVRFLDCFSKWPFCWWNALHWYCIHQWRYPRRAENANSDGDGSLLLVFQYFLQAEFLECDYFGSSLPKKKVKKSCGQVFLLLQTRYTWTEKNLRNINALLPHTPNIQISSSKAFLNFPRCFNFTGSREFPLY